MDVEVWLRGLGLGEYEAAFRENKIGGDVLPNLTADDLKELGVTVVGHRRKLLTAIASLGPSLGTSDMAATASLPVPGDKHAQDTAERRQLTVTQRSSFVGCAAYWLWLPAEPAARLRRKDIFAAAYRQP